MFANVLRHIFMCFFLTLFKQYGKEKTQYGHLVIWSFGQNAKKKVCQNLYSIIYNIYYTIAQITHFHFLKMTK